MKGVCVNRPIGDYFKKGLLSAIVFSSKTKFEEPVLLCYGNKVLGKIEITKETEVSADKLQDSYGEHRISKFQQMIIWQHYNNLWKYNFKVLEELNDFHTHKSSKVTYVIENVNIIPKEDIKAFM